MHVVIELCIKVGWINNPILWCTVEKSSNWLFICQWVLQYLQVQHSDIPHYAQRINLVTTNSQYSLHALNDGIVVSEADCFQCAMLSESLTHFITIFAFKGIAVDQAVFRRSLIAEARFSSQPMRYFLFLQWHCDKFLSEHSTFPCQYPSTNAS